MELHDFIIGVSLYFFAYVIIYCLMNYMLQCTPSAYNECLANTFFTRFVTIIFLMGGVVSISCIGITK